MARQIDFWTLLKLTQEYVSQHYAAVLTDKTKLGQLKAYVDKYLRDNDYHVENLTTKELIDNECCAFFFSVLTVNSILFRVSISAQKRFKSWLLPEKGQMHLFVLRFFRFSKKREKRRKKEKTGEIRRFSAPDLLRPDALWCAVGLDLSRIKRDLFQLSAVTVQH